MGRGHRTCRNRDAGDRKHPAPRGLCMIATTLLSPPARIWPFDGDADRGGVQRPDLVFTHPVLRGCTSRGFPPRVGSASPTDFRRNVVGDAHPTTVKRASSYTPSSVGVPEPLAEVVLPAIGEPGGLRRAAEQLLVLRVDRVEPDHVGDGQPLIRPLDRLDGVARPDLALGRHREVEAGPAVPEHPLEHVHPAEPDPELVAGQPRLGDDELGRPDPEAVADPHVLDQPLGGQVLAEDGPGEFHARKLPRAIPRSARTGRRRRPCRRRRAPSGRTARRPRS